MRDSYATFPFSSISKKFIQNGIYFCLLYSSFSLSHQKEKEKKSFRLVPCLELEQRLSIHQFGRNIDATCNNNSTLSQEAAQPIGLQMQQLDHIISSIYPQTPIW